MVTGLFDRKKGENMILKNDVVFIISLTISIVVAIATFGYNSYTETKSVERNIESAIVKGIDPIAVRCAYAKQSDMICIVYASSSSPVSTPSRK
jgi:hypothetical protein